MPDQVQVTDSGIQGQLAQISMELGKQSTTLAVIDTKLNSVVAAATDHESRIRSLERLDVDKITENRDGLEKLGARVATLEAFKYKLMGAIILASAAFSALGVWVGVLLRRG